MTKKGGRRDGKRTSVTGLGADHVEIPASSAGMTEMGRRYGVSGRAANRVGFGPQIKSGATEGWLRVLEMGWGRFPLGGGNDGKRGRE